VSDQARWQARLMVGLLLAPAILWLLGLIVLPHVDLAVLSLRERVGPREYQPSLAQYRTFFLEPLYWHVFVRTAVLSVLSTALTLLVAFPIAWVIAKVARGRSGSLLFLICLIPFWVSETVRTLGWMILLRESGVLPALLVRLGITPEPIELLYHDATLLVGLVYTSMLFMVVPLVSALESLDDALIEAAYDLGANGFAILRTIIIPHAAPGITAGCIVVFMLTLGNYLTPTLPVHHALQLGTGRRVRLPAAGAVHVDRVGRSETCRPALRRSDAADMIPSLPRPAWLRAGTTLTVVAFLLFLFLPLIIVAVFAFNDAPYPAPPWRGFTLDWFLGNQALGRTGMFQDSELLASIGTSCLVAVWVTVLSVLLGTTNAFLIERCRFPGKQALSFLMLAPLVIPGVILGISILAFASRLADLADDMFGLELDFLRPGLPLVVLGQFSYIATIATLTISARLKRFDRTLEEAALNLGASQAALLRTILLPYLRPALIGSAAISFLMSFADFNTTLMLVGSDSPLTVMMYGRMREGATPVVNAVSLFLMLASALLALSLLRRGKTAR
jgi:spermidine/putrescine transport system permease protein